MSVIALAVCLAPTFAGAGTIFNGHEYQLVNQANIDWNTARTGAQALGPGWDLAAITSAAEQAFIETLLPTAVPGGKISEFWLGGFQPAGSTEPGGGWSWVTGEAWGYTNWGAGEPNNSGGSEQHLAVDDRYLWGWNDNTNSIGDIIEGYIAEREALNVQGVVPVPAAGWLALPLLLGLGLMRRFRR